MQTLTQEENTTAARNDIDLDHFFCYCNPDKGLCGTNLTDYPFLDDDEEVDCVVCLAMVDMPCPLCGALE
jgi:hypothetical protein